MKSRNPVLPPQWYLPDGEPHFWGGELYVYPSRDLMPGYYCSRELYVAHSRDLSQWQVEGPAFSCDRLDWEPVIPPPPGLTEATGYRTLPAYLRNGIPKYKQWFLPFPLYKGRILKEISRSTPDSGSRKLFAPDALEIDGRYALFFCTSDGYEGVAFSQSPTGPFENPVMITGDRSGDPIQGIDPAVFRDDDGKVYLYWGQIRSCAAQLTDDLTKIREDTLVTNLLNEWDHGFHEGSSIRKIGDTYYAVFSDMSRGRPTSLGYATSASPLGPFRYRGIIVDNDGCDPATWNNHGSIECVDGQWYVFYHRSTGNSACLRRMCAEPITVLPDGTIPEVAITSIGMGAPFAPGERLEAYRACRVKNACIDGDQLLVNPGGAQVVYRYLAENARDFARLTAQGAPGAKIRHRVDEAGELTITIETGEPVKIAWFQPEG